MRPAAATLRSIVSAVSAVSRDKPPSEPSVPCVISPIAFEMTGHATATRSAVLASVFTNSHHDCTLTKRLRPLSGFRRPKSGLSFFAVGLKPTCATFAATPTTTSPMNNGATMPAAFHAASAAKRRAAPSSGCAMTTPICSRIDRSTGIARAIVSWRSNVVASIDAQIARSGVFAT